MNGQAVQVLLAAVVGFVLGGALREVIGGAAGVVATLGAIGGFAGAAIGAIVRRDVTRWGAVGGGIGLVLGALVVVLDVVLGRLDSKGMLRSIAIGSALLAPIAITGTILVNVLEPPEWTAFAFVVVLGVLAAVIGIAVDEHHREGTPGRRGGDGQPADA